jgi:hypothetical protein
MKNRGLWYLAVVLSRKLVTARIFPVFTTVFRNFYGLITFFTKTNGGEIQALWSRKCSVGVNLRLKITAEL